jgi:uncharacterized protein with PIN domain
MDEDKAGTATAYISCVRCLECGVEMYAKKKNARIEGSGVYYEHTEDILYCPNAGKRFKVATVELEELR